MNKPARKPLLGVTGPSGFNEHVWRMAEDDKGLGANFVLLYQQKEENILAMLDVLDGVVVAGGLDIHPSVYGNNVLAGRGLTKFDIGRDARELRLVAECVRRSVPMLCICRGHQMLAIHKGFGNEFVMDLRGFDVVHNPGVHGITIDKGETCHAVKFVKPNIFSADDPPEREVFRRHAWEEADDARNGHFGWVNSFHHQGIRYLKSMEKEYGRRNIAVLGTAPTGASTAAYVRDIVEMAAGVGEPWISVQWHPEFDYAENHASEKVVAAFRDMLRTKEPMIHAEG